MNREIIQGNVFETIKQIADETVDCVVTSPPYWGLRDYGTDEQMGLESDFHVYLEKLRGLMVEIKRILKPTGTVFVNLGDTYSTMSGGMKQLHEGKGKNYGQIDYTKNKEYGESLGVDQRALKKNLQSKCRVAIPERFYINCIDDGWIVRNHLIWYKSNSMPSSVKDRFSNKWESVFFMVKEEKYFFDLDAVRVPSLSEVKPLKTKEKQPHTQASLFGDDDGAAVGIHEKYAAEPQSNVARLHKDRPGNPNERKWEKDMGQPVQSIAKNHSGIYDKNTGECLNDPKGKNPGDVLFINPKPFIEAHFATFPVALPMELIKAGCPEQVCMKCRKPRFPIWERTKMGDTTQIRTLKIESEYQLGKTSSLRLTGGGDTYNSWKEENPDKFMGLTDCGCKAGFEPGLVFDPFFGSGTVGVAAEKLNRRWMGSELNPEYIKIAQKRLEPYKNTRLVANE